MESPSAPTGGGSARRIAHSLSPLRLPLLLAALVGFLGACNLGGGADRVQQGTPGSEENKPGGGGTFIVDENEGGAASRLRIEEMFWGRLVDVYGASFDTDTSEWVSDDLPAFADFTINETFQADATAEEFAAGFGNFFLTTNPITLKTRLIIRRVKGDPEPSPGAGTFFDLLMTTTASMPPIDPKHDNGSSVEPFSFIARNAVLVIRLNDLLDDSEQAASNLLETVRVVTGYRPNTPFAARVVFDENFGGIAGGQYHTTRVLVDMTISDVEAFDMSTALGVNMVGLPASLTTTGQPNTSIRIPSREDISSGQFSILRSHSGKPMTTASNGPVDFDSPTLDIVRAMRAGNPEDSSNGFLLDEVPPRIVGGWQLSVIAATDDPAGSTPGRNFVLDLDFATACMAAPRSGDIINLVGGYYVEVTEDGVQPDDVTGQVSNVRVRLITGDDVTNPNLLLGLGIFLAPYDEELGVDGSCWVTFTPLPTSFPAAGVAPDAQIMVRFSEPMDPQAISPFDTIFVVRGDSSTVRHPSNTVVGTITTSTTLKEHAFNSLLDFAHAGDSQPYHVEIVTGVEGVSDLAGNIIEDVLPKIDFTIDPLAAPVSTGGIVLRFGTTDEYFDPTTTSAADGLQDLSGQMFYDTERGVILPRPVQRGSFQVDYNQGVPSGWVPIVGGVQTPLIPLGSKLMAVWRYFDMGLNVRDEAYFNLDVEGINWAPPGGQLISDFFEQFEMRLSHSIQLPDEILGGLIIPPPPQYPNSGLYNAPSRFDSNVLNGPMQQTTVHHRALGYQINPNELFVSASGTQMVPFPLNEGTGTPTYFTWRDTSDLGEGGFNGAGVPAAIEVQRTAETGTGSVAGPGQVPTIGLPLLMEFRCYPSDEGLGLNSLSVGQAVAGWNVPIFRVFSSGGIDQAFNQITKNPDLQDVPTGGYNPTGIPTLPGDNVAYIGQLDTVIRVSRIFTVWLHPGFSTPDYVAPVVAPNNDGQPEGTEILLAFRGAGGFTPAGDSLEFDGTLLDAYGDPAPGAGYTVTFSGDGTWEDDIDEVDGASNIQLRFTFVNNVTTGRNAELDSMGLAFSD